MTPTARCPQCGRVACGCTAPPGSIQIPIGSAAKPLSSGALTPGGEQRGVYHDDAEGATSASRSRTSSAAQDRRLWRVPRSFRAGKGRKVHVGTHRKGDVIYLACGMAGYVGSEWLVPTDDPYEGVTCGHCLRATT